MAVEHEIRDYRTGELRKVRLTRASAIKAFCRECLAGDVKAIRDCTGIYCPLYPFRPYRNYVKNPPKKRHFSVKVASENENKVEHRLAVSKAI